MCWKQCSATPLAFYILDNQCPVVVIAIGSCAKATVDLNWWMTEFSSLREEKTFGKANTLRNLHWKKHGFSFFLNNSSVPQVTNEEVFCFGTYWCAANYTGQNVLLFLNKTHCYVVAVDFWNVFSMLLWCSRGLLRCSERFLWYC